MEGCDPTGKRSDGVPAAFLVMFHCRMMNSVSEHACGCRDCFLELK